ncbi:MAG: T9SS type A sorting domain-containing protein [Bacteroidota bacterium]
MKIKKVQLGAILLLVLGLTELKAQVSLNASGGNAMGSGGSVSYSIGQTMYTTNTGTNGSVAQGVQQPFEISVVNGIEEAIGINLVCSAYPNPTKDNLTLKIEGELKMQYIALICDLNGKLLGNNKIESNETNIAMNNFSAGTYFLKVMQNNKEIKTFKIIKN